MKIGGVQKCSFIDYPSKISLVIFTQGCNFRCSYCHNPELVYPELFGQNLDESDIFKFLKERKNKIDAVVFSGGEPTLQNDIEEKIERVRRLGFLTKIDTNGSNPEILRKIIKKKIVDFISMDIKTIFSSYETIARVKISIEAIKKSIEVIRDSGINYEFRTVYDPEKISNQDLNELKNYFMPFSSYVIRPVKYY